MKRILFLFSLLLAVNAYAQQPQTQFKVKKPAFMQPGDSTKLATPPSAALNLKPSFAALRPGMVLTLNISEEQKTDQTPRLLRITLDDEKEYALQYTYQNVWAGKAIYKNPNKNGLSIVIKPLEPANYASSTNYRP